MWDRGRVLLAAVVFTVVYYSHAKQLDMAPYAVDYLCNKCHEKAMETFIDSGLLRQELNVSEKFQKAWNASTKCTQLIPGGTKEHTTAVLAYVNGDEEFITHFNNEVETMGGNVTTYEKHFSFKSFYFLLMDYMMLQKTKTCETVYALVEKYTAQTGSRVRLGRFTITETDFTTIKKWDDLDGQVVLNITSCFFAKLGSNVCMKKEERVLLSPTEVFTVESVKSVDLDDSTYTEIVLKHSDVGISQLCDICSRSPLNVSAHWLLLVIAVLSLFFFC